MSQDSLESRGVLFRLEAENIACMQIGCEWGQSAHRLAVLGYFV